LAVIGAAVVLGAAALGLALRGEGDKERVVASPSAVAVPPPVPPPRGDDLRDAPGEELRVADVLATLADRFGVVGVEPNGYDPDPAGMMERVARGLRYPGPFLSDAERDRLRADPGRDAALALRWDALIRRFAADRPLPADFRARPLRGQLAALAWSFHNEDVLGPVEPGGPRRASSEVVQALGESLAVDFPLRPTPLAGRYPALGRYLAFLGRLPRR
jgi:hypothetical protein